jgi:hypothetical protein
MASKTVTRSAGFSDIRYDVATHNLLFVGKGGGKSLMFLGVPPELFYGMPSGTNVDNFIQLKLIGRYSLVEIKPPPTIAYSTINKEFYLMEGDFTYTWKWQEGDPVALPENEHDAFARFMATVGRRPHDKMVQSHIKSAYTGAIAVEETTRKLGEYPYVEVVPAKPKRAKAEKPAAAFDPNKE